MIRSNVWTERGTEIERFKCALCKEDFEYFGDEVEVNENLVCAGCANDVECQTGTWDRMLKAERKVKELLWKIDGNNK